MLEKYVIIVAGGTGSRMKSSVPKQFMELCGKPVLMHTMQRFYDVYPDFHFILVLNSQFEQQWKSLCEKFGFSIQHQLVEGGETRFHSVKNGLSLVPDNAVVGVHDAARPLVSKQTILDAYEMAQNNGNASPAVALSESIRWAENGLNKAVPREQYVQVQTPQCFQSDLIKKAFLQEYQPAFTDDASVLESMGESIHLITGNKENIKITTPQDMIIAEAFMKSNRIY
jgi:2-C-methyl-D-erythritol 4-phosphate cytidylyltransferase